MKTIENLLKISVFLLFASFRNFWTRVFKLQRLTTGFALQLVHRINNY